MSKVTIALGVLLTIAALVALGLGAYARSQRDDRIAAEVQRDQCVMLTEGVKSAVEEDCLQALDQCRLVRRQEVERCHLECEMQMDGLRLERELTADPDELVDRLREILK